MNIRHHRQISVSGKCLAMFHGLASLPPLRISRGFTALQGSPCPYGPSRGTICGPESSIRQTSSGRALTARSRSRPLSRS